METVVSTLIKSGHLEATHIELLNALNSREATIGVIGLGYVGLPLAVTVST